MPDPFGDLVRARELLERGAVEEAESLVEALSREHPRDAAVLNLRAYLHYRRGRLEEAVAAYRRLADREPQVAAHPANLGLICFKAGRYAEAQAAFEAVLALQPDDRRALRNLGFCFERQQLLEPALACFVRAGDEENAAKVRARLPADSGAGPAAAAPPAGAPEPDVGSWLRGASLAGGGRSPDLVRAGAGELLWHVREKVCVNPAFCAGHRGVVLFAPASREAEKAAAKFGEPGGVLARAEGNGELILAGRGRSLLALRLAGERLHVNYAALVLCGAGVQPSFAFAGLLERTFLAVELSGHGAVILATRGAPVVLPVAAELPTLARPGAVVAWTERLAHEPESVRDLRKLVGKEEALRYRFAGQGHLVLQSC